MTISQDLCGWVSLKEQKISPLQYRINTFHNQNYYFLWYSFILLHWFRFKKGKVWRKQLNSYLPFPTLRCFFCSYGSKRKKLAAIFKQSSPEIGRVLFCHEPLLPNSNLHKAWKQLHHHCVSKSSTGNH